MAFFLISQTLMSLSMPPVNSSFPASARQIAVMGKSVGMNATAAFVLVSQSCRHSQNNPKNACRICSPRYSRRQSR